MCKNGIKEKIKIKNEMIVVSLKTVQISTLKVVD